MFFVPCLPGKSFQELLAVGSVQTREMLICKEQIPSFPGCQNKSTHWELPRSMYNPSFLLWTCKQGPLLEARLPGLWDFISCSLSRECQWHLSGLQPSPESKLSVSRSAGPLLFRVSFKDTFAVAKPNEAWKENRRVKVSLSLCAKRGSRKGGWG